MEVSEAIKTLSLISSNIWMRDKVLLADKISAVLPDIVRCLVEQSSENEQLKKHNQALQFDLDTANNCIERLNRENVNSQRLQYFAGQRAAALIRIAEALEALK